MRVRTIRVTHVDTLPLIRKIGVIRGPFTPANFPEDGGASNMNTERLSNPSRLLAQIGLYPS